MLRVVVAEAGPEGEDRSAVVLARALRDAGHEVVYTGAAQSEEEIAATAVQEDADLIGIPIRSAVEPALLGSVVDLLAERGADDIGVFAVGVLAEADAAVLAERGLVGAFAPEGSAEEAPGRPTRQLLARITTWLAAYEGAQTPVESPSA